MAGQVDARGGLLVGARFTSDAIQKHANLKEVGTISVNPPSATAGVTVTHAVTITGAKVGDLIFMVPPDTLETGLVFEGAAVTGDDTVTVAIHNPSAGTVDGAAREWAYLLFGKTE